MKTAVRNIVFFMVIWVYIFGSSGFTVHHCCCKKHYHVTCAIINAWEHYVFSGCENHHHTVPAPTLEENTGGCPSAACESVIRPIKEHCADFVYTMDGTQYSNEDNLQAPVAHLVELFQQLPADLNSISPNQYESADIGLFFNYDTSHYRYRQWCRPDILCTFLI